MKMQEEKERKGRLDVTDGGSVLRLMRSESIVSLPLGSETWCDLEPDCP